MSIQTIKQFTCPAGRLITVDRGGSHTPSAFINIDGESRSAFGWVPSADVPALALALLEAAGYDGKCTVLDSADGAVRVLRRHIEKQSEDRAKAELDKEADEIRRAWQKGAGRDTETSWAHVRPDLKDGWREVARKVREGKAAA